MAVVDLFEMVTSAGVEHAIARAKLGDGLSSHNFRHTFASLLIVGLNLDPVRVQKQLGHTDPAFTMKTYAHMFEQSRHATELRDKLAGGFGHLLDVTEMSPAPGFDG
jgi:integrase